MKLQYKFFALVIISVVTMGAWFTSITHAQNTTDRNGYHFGSGYLIPSIQPVATQKEYIENIKIGEEKTITLENIFTNLSEIRKYFNFTMNAEDVTLVKFTNTGNKEIPTNNINLNTDGEGTILVDKNMTTEAGEYKLDISVCSEGEYMLQSTPKFTFLLNEVEIEDEE